MGLQLDLNNDAWRKNLGDAGEVIVCQELINRGWVADRQPGNFRNVDIMATKCGITASIQVKTHNVYKWVFGGGVNAAICNGSPLFNRAARHSRCDFVILLSPAEPSHAGLIGNDWRFFVMPVAAAEAAFRLNIDAYFNTPKKDGSAKRPNGAVRDFVGPGELTHSIPDNRNAYLRFEGAFHVLEALSH